MLYPARLPAAAESEALQQRIDEVSADKLEVQASLQEATGEAVAAWEGW